MQHIDIVIIPLMYFGIIYGNDTTHSPVVFVEIYLSSAQLFSRVIISY